jgi:hypothetical protein
VRLRSGARVLRQFTRETGNPELSEVTPESVAMFLRAWPVERDLEDEACRARGLVPLCHRPRLYDSLPLPEWTPRLPSPQTPPVPTSDELQRLLAATATLSNPCSRLQAATYKRSC